MKKKKLPPVSKARQAVFDKCNISPEKQAQLHREICETPEGDLMRLMKYSGVTEKWVDKEVTGNLMIEGWAAKQIERKNEYARMAWARSKWVDFFYQTFRRPLGSFWEGNALGLDVCRLDRDVIQPPDGISAYDHVKNVHGEMAVTMLEELIHGIDAPHSDR